MRTGALLSALLHGLILLLLWTGIHNFFRRNLEPPPIIPIEVINISDVTQAPALKVKPKDDAPETEKKEDKPTPPQPTPEPEPEQKPEPEEKVEPEKEPEPNPKPEPEPEPEPKVEPEKKAEPEKTLDELLAAIPEEKPKKKEKKKEKEKKKKKKKKKKDFMALLNNIDKTKSSSEGKTQQEQDEDSTSDHAANVISDVLAITELDLIRRQLQACWNVPAGARDAKDLYVDVRIEMNSDATVRSAVIIETGGNSSYKKVAADSALRAVKNPKCNPLKVPLNRYDQWKTITVRFDPKHIL